MQYSATRTVSNSHRSHTKQITLKGGKYHKKITQYQY